MRIELTEAERQYIDSARSEQPEFEIFLSRVFNKPLNELQELADACAEAVQNYQLNEPKS